MFRNGHNVTKLNRCCKIYPCAVFKLRQHKIDSYTANTPAQKIGEWASTGIKPMTLSMQLLADAVIQLAFVWSNQSPVCLPVLVQDARSHFLRNCEVKHNYRAILMTENKVNRV